MHLDLAAALRAFVRTVERGSITSAARDLGLSQPAVTKQLKNLEAHVGARLLERSTKIVRPTPLGQSLYESSRSALATIDSAVEGVRRDMGAVQGLLRVHAPSCIGAKHLHPIVAAFQDLHLGVTVDLFLEDRRVDIVYDNFDVALKYGKPDGQDLIVRRVGHVRRILVASPAFIKRHGEVRSLRRLEEIPLITTAAVFTPRDALVLTQRGADVEVEIAPALRTNNANVVEHTLLSGRAAGPVQQLLVDDHLSEGRLVRILPRYEVKSTDAFLAFPSVRYMRPAVRAFSDFLVPALKRLEGMAS
jgi:DNA-binding transcriptional LysR family regulator